MTTPAAHTRKEAIVSAGKERRPIFAAIKFIAQITTIRLISEAMTRRLGAPPLECSTSTESNQPFFPHGEFFDPIAPRLVADARPAWHADRALPRDGHFRFDDVLVPVAAACGDIPWQREVGEGRERNVMRTADSGLQHSSAPHGNASSLAEIMDAARDRVSPHPSQLDVDNLA